MSGQIGALESAYDSRLSAIEAALKTVAARPEPKCPACVCGEHPLAAASLVPDGGAPPATAKR
jgi:hypothetical protein